MSAAIAIFVKTPDLSPVKTRLAATIGKDKALEFYQLSVKAVERTIINTEAKPFWAVGEIDGIDNPLWSEFDNIYTGDGCLGERQNHIYRSLLKTHDKAILIGADAPQISPDIINKAIAALDNNDFVIGGASDGGYYLFGGREPIDPNIWTNTPWSDPATRECLAAALPSKPAHLPILTDVDTIDNLTSILAEMPANTSPEQQSVIKWVTSLENKANDCAGG